MSNLNEYPKAIYSPEGAFRVVHDKDAEDAQLLAWGVEPELEVIDLPPLPPKPPSVSAGTNGVSQAPKAAKPRVGRQKKTA